MVWKFPLESDSYKIEITGGRVLIYDKATGELLKEHKGYNYLYTGDVSPDNSEFFALENGKHFYVYSLNDLELKKKITLPRSYESIDLLGFYSEDGKAINIPASKYVYTNKVKSEGYYENVLFHYSTEDYSLTGKTMLKGYNDYEWNNNSYIKDWMAKNAF